MRNDTWYIMNAGGVYCRLQDQIASAHLRLTYPESRQVIVRQQPGLGVTAVDVDSDQGSKWFGRATQRKASGCHWANQEEDMQRSDLTVPGSAW